MGDGGLFRFVCILSLLFWTYTGAYAASSDALLNLYRMTENEEIAQSEFVKNNKYLQLYTKTNRMILQEKLDKARSREQSLANKILGAAAIGASGIGGMMLASGLSEQQSDADAERAMRAYLATFTCKYGDKRVNGGAVDVELPGGNELVGLYSEYVALANDLKVRKAALGIKPGIESESILDSATSGLYDDISVGKTSGVYTSLSRALSDPNGADAAAWAAQKEESSKKVTTGATVGGVGAAGGAIGNLIINRDKK